MHFKYKNRDYDVVQACEPNSNKRHNVFIIFKPIHFGLGYVGHFDCDVLTDNAIEVAKQFIDKVEQ